MKTHTQTWMLVLLMTCAGACYRNAYIMPNQPVPKAMPDVDEWNHHFIAGLIGGGKYKLEHYCGGNVAAVQNYVSPVGVLLGIITLSIYVPTTTRIWCGPAKREGEPAPVAPAAHPG